MISQVITGAKDYRIRGGRWWQSKTWLVMPVCRYSDPDRYHIMDYPRPVNEDTARLVALVIRDADALGIPVCVDSYDDSPFFFDLGFRLQRKEDIRMEYRKGLASTGSMYAWDFTPKTGKDASPQ